MLILKCCEIVVTFCYVSDATLIFVDLKRDLDPFPLASTGG